MSEEITTTSTTEKNNKNQVSYEKHLSYILSLNKTKDSDAIGYYSNEYLKIAAFYWGIGALSCLNKVDSLNKDEVIAFVLNCQQQSGGFGGSIGHDETITNTHYSLLILLSLDSSKVNLISEGIVKYIKSLQNPSDGSFKLDKFGETDTRFSYCAVSSLKLLNRLEEIDLNKATEFILSCQNFDGGFGGTPGAESHAAYTFCCVGFLGITNQLHLINQDLTCQWLAARQTHLGGFNGRPEKLADVCYSWWVLSCFYMMKKENYIDKDLLKDFIFKCQDVEDGGFGDRPGNCNDVFHTFFGLAALSLMNEAGLKKIDPFYAIDEEIIKKISI